MPPNRYYFLPFKVKIKVGSAGIHVMVDDARGSTIIDAWNEEVAEFIEGQALDTAAQMLGYRSYEAMRG